MKKGFSATGFRAWQKRMGHTSKQETADALAVSRTSVIKWLRRGCPYTIKLACIGYEVLKEDEYHDV